MAPNPTLLFAEAQSLTRRFVPVPPSTYIAGAKLSVKLIIAIVFIILISILSVACLCCICIRRAKSKRRARRLAKEAAESKALPPKINRRNARFFGPGIVKDEEVEMASFLGQDVGRQEVRQPNRVRGGWREVMRAVSRR
ncbi:hypothetical protein N431DRAFT_426317 [Stipitochalara longipes BDJ]|nr:hypothetical protein N431DRAFT_426317 [Stipitochalara longipes BDJ]